MQTDSEWRPIETAPQGWPITKVIFKGFSKAGSFSGPVYVSGWVDDGKPVYFYQYKLNIVGWKPVSILEEPNKIRNR